MLTKQEYMAIKAEIDLCTDVNQMGCLLSELKKLLLTQEDDYAAALVRDLWHHATGQLPWPHEQLRARMSQMNGMPNNAQTLMWVFGLSDERPGSERERLYRQAMTRPIPTKPGEEDKGYKAMVDMLKRHF